MPQVLLSDSISAELGAQEPWPKDVKLFKPFDVEQILLADSAACLSVSAFLQMCKLPFKVIERANAEYMSPTGKVPFIKAGAFVIAELDQIISFVGHKNISLTSQLDTSQKADMRAYMSLVNNVLGSAEMFISWVDKCTYNEVTFPRFGCVHPFPLNLILSHQKRSTVLNKLDLLGWKRKSLEEVYSEVDYCCLALSQRLGNKPFFFGENPTELDAVVYAHLFTLLTTPLGSIRLGAIVRKYQSLVTLVSKIDAEYFDRSSEAAIAGTEGDGRTEGDRQTEGDGQIETVSPPNSSENGDNGDYDKLEDAAAIS